MTNDAVEDKSPNPIDIYVGKRIRERRKEFRISQEKLADRLGLTFQQVQKYEKGANRVSCSKLYEISRALQVSIEYFFQGLPDPLATNGGVAENGGEPFLHDFSTTAEGQELAREFPKISDPQVRRSVLELVKSLAMKGGAKTAGLDAIGDDALH
jgi:transcriptional regulator with XRE-family HTH domain